MTTTSNAAPGLGTQTLLVHGGPSCDPTTGATAVPIYQTTAYAYKSAQEIAEVFRGEAPGYVYTRVANPTTLALECRLAELEGGIGCVATSSGMAAIASTMTALVRTGSEIVSAAGIFGGTISLFCNTLGRFGVKTVFVDAEDTDGFRDAIGPDTGAVFLETIGNPRMDVPDMPAIAEIAHAAGVPLVVDGTVTTPLLVKPGDHGADVVIYSTSKYVNGHGTAIGGAIVDTGNFDWSQSRVEDIRDLVPVVGRMAFLKYQRSIVHRDLGGCASPTNSFYMLQGLESLGPRMERHCGNALALAGYLDAHPDVPWVNYPGLADSPFFGRTEELFGGQAGGLVTFGLGTIERAYGFIDALRLAKVAANIGDAKTLVIHPASTIFSEFGDDLCSRSGVTDDMVRVSVGIEDFDDIRNDFAQAIDTATEMA